MDNRLELLIVAGLNESMSTKEIKQGLEKLSKHPALKLKVDLQIDKNLLKEFSRLSEELNKLTNYLHDQSSATDQVKRSIDGAKASVDSETASVERNTRALADNQAMREKITKGADFTRTDITRGTRFRNVTESVTLRKDKGRVAHPTVTHINHEALREAQKQLQIFTEDSNRRIQALTKTFGEGSEEIIKLKNAIMQLAPESSKVDFTRVNNQIKELEQRQKGIEAIRNRVAQLVTEIQRFNRAGKELPYGKGSTLDKMLNDLRAMDLSNLDQASQRVNKLENDFKRLNQTVKARDGLLRQLDNLRRAGTVDAGKIADLETRILKAESPEQILRLAKAYGALRKEHLQISQVEDRKITILKEINNLRQRGVITEQQALALEKELANAQSKRAVSSAKRQVSDLSKEVNLRQQNLNTLKQTELQLLRLEKNPLARRYRGELSAINAELRKINLSSATTADRLSEIRHRLSEISIEATGTTYKTSTWLGAFQNAMYKFPLWMGASTLFFGTVRGIRSALQNIIEIDSQMTTLARVSGGEIDRNHILREAGDLAARLGNELKSVNEGIVSFARMGFRGDELIAMTEAATLFSNISEMSVDEAASGLIAAIKGFDMLPEEAMRIVDAVNEVDNNFSITSQTIMEAFQRSIGAAQSFGVEMEELIGMITGIGQVTRESGSVIGNSLKTIFSRITTMDSSIEALAKVGVSITEIRDGVESLRPVADILHDLGQVWGELNEEQQQSIGLQIAGRYQLSRFLVLMQQQEEVIKATNTALNSQGSGYRENAQYLKSLEARINIVKNSWTELTLAMGDAVLTETFIGILNSLRTLANGVKVATDNIGLLPTVLGVVGVAFTAFSAKARSSIMGVMTLLGAKNTLLQSVALSTNLWATAMGASAFQARLLSVAVTGLVASLRTLLISTGVGVAVAGVGYALERLINHFSKVREKSIKLREEQELVVNSWTTQESKIRELITRYNELNDVQNKNEEQELEYLQVQNELANLMPNLIAHIDSKGQAHLKSANAIQREIELTELLIQKERERTVLTSKDNFDKIIDNRTKSIEKLRAIEESLEKGTVSFELPRLVPKLGYRRGQKLTEEMGIDLEIEALKERLSLQEVHEQVSADITNLALALSDLSGIKIQDTTVSQLIEQIVSSFDSLDDLSSVEYEKIAYRFSDLIQLVDTYFNDGSDRFVYDSLRQFTDELKTSFPESTKEIDELLQALLRLGNDVSVTGSSLNQTFKLFDDSGNLVTEFTGTLEELGKQYDIIQEKLDEDGAFEGYIINLKDATEETKTLADVIKEPISELKSFNQILDTVNKGQSLSADAVADLILKYPELATQVEKTTDGYKINSDALETLRQIKIQEANDAIQAEIEKTKSTLDHTSDRLKAYELELDAIMSLADAHREISKLGVSKIFGEDSFKDMSFDDVNRTITIGGVTTDWSDNEDLYRRVSSSLREQQKAYETMIRIGELRESQKVLKNLLSDETFGITSSSSFGKSSLSKEFQQFPYYKQQIDDLNSELTSLNKSIEQYAREIQQADKMEDLTRKMKLETEYAELLDQRKNKYHEIANVMRSLRDSEIIPQFDKVFSDFRKGRNLEDISQVETQKYLDELNSQISRTENEKVKNDLERKRDLFNYFMGLFNDLDSAIKQQSDGWWQDLFGKMDTLANVTNQTITNLFKDFEAVTAPYDKAITDLQRKIELLDETDEDYYTSKVNYSSKIIDHYNTQSEAIKIIIDRLQQAKEEYKKIPSQVERIQKEIDKWQSSLDDIPLQIKRINDDLKKQKEDIAKRIIDVYKKAYEAQRDAEIKAIEQSMKAEEERHKQRIKNLDDEYKKFEDNVNAIIKSIDRQASEEDYQEELEELYLERDKIKERLAKLSLSSDMADKAKALELERDLASKENEIGKLKRNRENELRKQNLQDLLDSKRKEVDGAKKTEDERYEHEKRVLDALKEAREQHWKAIIDNEERYLKIQNDILSGKLDEIESELSGFKSSISIIMGSIGDGIANNLIFNLDQALKLLNEVRNQSSGLSQISGAIPSSSTGGVSSEFYVPSNPQEKSVIDLMKQNSRLWNETTDQRLRDEYHESNKILGKSIGATYDSKGHWYKNGLRIYHDGGIVGGKGAPLLEQLHKMLNLGSNERLSVVELGELIIKKNPLANIAQNFKMPNLNFQKAATSSPNVINEININIDKVYGSKQSGQNLADDVIKRLSLRGIRIN